MRQKSPLKTTHSKKGFTIIELMVGMLIAMIIFLVISFVFSNFENQKRLTTTSSDTQSSGLTAMVQLEQDLRSAGAGFVDPNIFDCKYIYSYYNDGTSTLDPAPGYTSYFAPAVITDGGATGSDTITIRASGGDLSGAIPTQLAVDLTPSSTLMAVNRGIGFKTGQVVLLKQGNNCSVHQVSSVTATANFVNLTTGGVPTWNPTSAYQASGTPGSCAATAPPPVPACPASGWPTYNASIASVYSIGIIQQRTYSVNASKQLQVVTASAGTTTTTDALVGDVVSVQAQYGVSSAAGVQDVSSWVSPTGTWAATALDASAIKRIKAIRIVVIVRSPKFETANVTSTCVNNAGTNNGPCAWRDSATSPAPLIDLSSDANWQHYRYKTFQTIVPLRNVIWAGV